MVTHKVTEHNNIASFRAKLVQRFQPERIFPNSRLKGSANLLIMPDLDAANIAFNLIKAVGDGVNVGPILAGVARPAHVLTQSITVRGIVNMSAIAVVDAQEYEATGGASPVLP